MPDPVTAVIGVASVAGSAYSANQQSKAANKSRKSADAAAALQYDIADRQQVIAEAQWKRYLDTFAPVETSLAAQSQQAIAPDYGRVVADVQSAAAGARDQGMRYMGRRGVNPAAGQALALNQQYNRALALDTVGAVRAEGQRARDETWTRQMGVANLGRSLPNQAMSGFGSAAGTVGQIGSQQTALAGLHAQQAAQAWQGVGNMAGNVFGQYMAQPATLGYGQAAGMAMPVTFRGW